MTGEAATQGYPEAPAIPSVRDLAPGKGVPGGTPVPEQPVPRDEVVAPQEPGARDAGADAASPTETRVDLPPVTGDAAAPVEQDVQDVQVEGEDAAQWEELQEQHKELPREEPRPEFQPANDVERALLHAAATNDHDLFLQTLADAEVLVPVPEDMDYALRPGKPGFPWQTREIDGVPAVPVYTSPERLVEAEGAATGSVTLPFTGVLRYWPHPNWMLAINSGAPAGGTILAEQLPGLAAWADQRAARRMAENFEPQNEVEQRLFDAALRRDTDAFFKVLLGAQVLVPADPDTPWGIAPDDPEFPWRPVPVHGRTAIQVFTSLKWMTDAIGSSRFVMPGFLEVVTAWPEGDWTLVLNPGTPVDASLTAEQVRALSGPARVEEPGPDDEPSPLRSAPEAQATAAPDEPPDAEVEEPLFEPGNRIDQELYEAVLAGDSDAFLRVLLAANVLVPIPQDAPLEVTPIQREFRWEAALRGDDAVQVFTSLVRLREVLPESRFVYADFRELIGSWPHQDWAMLLNPGTRIGASLRGDQVRALSEWAVRVGLVRPLSEAPTTPVPVQEPQAAPESFAAPEADPAQTVQDVPAGEFDVPAAQEPVHEDVAPPVDPQRNGAPARPERLLPPEPEGEPVQQPAIMQKVVPHPHVSWYLEQGYDRIGGFVHPTSDVADLQTPQQLYETLGLLYEGSPFSPDDEGVYVIRWPAYCPGLYRIPFGGRTEEELAAWGDAGWVLESEPFEGTGFAPGSAGTIREYKVDSIRLPYGAEMYRLGADRSERFIAMYDPDRLAWLRPEGAGSGEEQADRRAEG
ncbi:SseB family protein [Actinomadura kijaniata]|uniref:SseB family protein n=1 Tax=Actinomadura kijaniata TaxID=46161 RepID=UPI003F1DDC3C